MSAVGTEGLQERVCFLDIFTPILAYFPDFKIFSYVEQIKNLSFRSKIANTKTTMTILIECIALVLSHHTGVITRRVKEKSAALHSK